VDLRFQSKVRAITSPAKPNSEFNRESEMQFNIRYIGKDCIEIIVKTGNSSVDCGLLTNQQALNEAANFRHAAEEIERLAGKE